MTRKLTRVLAAVAVLVALAGGAAPRVDAAGAAGSATVKINQVDASAYPGAPIKVYVSVTDAQGSPLTTLTKDDFQLSLDGKPLVITGMTGLDAKAVQTPIQLVLAMDTSRNMRGDPLKKARAAAIEFVDQLRPGDKVSIWQFDDKPVEVEPRDDCKGDKARPECAMFTDNKDVLKGKLGRLVAGGGKTALNDTLFTVSRAVMARQGRRALIIVTHGKNDSVAKGELLGGLAAAVDAQAPAYLLGFGEVDEANLETIARETGGEFLKEPESDGVGKLFDQLKELLQNQYELQAELPVEKVDGKEHSFTATVDIAGKRATGAPKGLVIVQVVPIPAMIRTLTARAPTATPGPGPTTPVPPLCPTPPCPPEQMPVALIVGLLVLGGAIAYLMRGKKGGGGGGIQNTTKTWIDEDSGPDDGGVPIIVPPVPIQHGPDRAPRAGGTVVLHPVAKALLAGETGPFAGQQLDMLAMHGGAGQPTKDTWEIGREGPQDMVLADETVSRRHAKIRFEWTGQGKQRTGRFVIHDLAASNPIQVNGQIVVSQALKDGDRVTIGATTFVFKRFDLQLPGPAR